MTLRPIFVIVVLGLFIASCGGGTSEPAAGEDTTTTTEDVATTTTTTAPSAQTDDDGVTTTTAADEMAVHVATTDMGEVLVGPDGLTLYVFTADSPGTSTCYEGCAELWPPVPADVAIGSGLDESIFGSTTRDDASDQLTVNEMPLYWYTPDTEPGDTMGQGFNDVWFVVDASGNMVQGAAGSGDTIVDYGY